MDALEERQAALWTNPARRARPPEVPESARPLLLVAETFPTLQPIVENVCGFLRVRAKGVAPRDLQAALAADAPEGPPVGLLCHAERTGPSLAMSLRAVVATDPGLPVMVVTDQDVSRQARLAVGAEIIRLDRLVWLERMPDLRRMVDFLFLAERRVRPWNG